MLEVNDFIRYQADMQQAIMDGFKRAMAEQQTGFGVLQVLAQEAVHCTLVSKVASEEAKRLYDSLS